MMPSSLSRARRLIVPLLALTAAAAGAQSQARGIDVAQIDAAPGIWRAVVVGVSRYAALPTLSFTDNDAEAVYRFLISKDGGKLDTANVQLLLDKEATRPAIAQALIRMATASRKGDRLLLYFAGHGDVQRISADDAGGTAYLLLANATPGIYDGSNDVIDPQELQGFVEKRMAKNGGEFIVVLDACRSGAVADMKEGAQAAMRSLSQWQGVNKLLSSTGTQLSHEAAEWGGGHGVFTYYLLEALYGLADADHDSTLTFREIDRYVSDSVERATSRPGFSLQTPTAFAANPRERLFRVDGPRDAALRALRGGSVRTLTTTSRGVTGTRAELAIEDTVVAKLVEQFRQAIARGQLLEPQDKPSGKSAWSLQARIVARLDTTTPAAADLAVRVRGTLAVALQEFAEGPTRRFFRGVSDYPSPREFRDASRALGAALELLGPAHDFAGEILWREEFMAAFAIVRERNFSRFPEAETKLKDALARTNGAAPVQAALATLYRAKRDVPTARRYLDEAIRRAPRWEYAQKLRADLLNDEGKVAESIAAYEEMTRRFPNSSAAYNNVGVLYSDLDRNADARRSFQRAWRINHEPLYLANLASVAIDQKRYAEADSLITAALAMDSTLSIAYYQRGRLLRVKHEGTAAIAAFRRAAALDPFDTRSHSAIAGILEASNGALAENEYRAALAVDPDDPSDVSSLAYLMHQRGDTSGAVASLAALEKRLPGRAATAASIGWFYDATDRPALAERWLREAVARDSLHYSARIELAKVLAEAGRDSAARAEFVRARVLAVGNPQPAIEYARYLYRKGVLADAAREYRQALATDSLLTEIRVELAEVVADLGRTSESLALYRRAIAASESAYDSLDVAMRFETRAAAMEFARRDTAALDLWKAAHSLVPDRVRSQLGLARVHYVMGSRPAARAILDSLVRTLPADDRDVLPVVWHIQSLVIFEDGNQAAALIRLDSANARRGAPDLATRAAMLWALGRRDAALAELAKAIRPIPLVRLSGRAAAAFAELQQAASSPARRPEERR